MKVILFLMSFLVSGSVIQSQTNEISHFPEDSLLSYDLHEVNFLKRKKVFWTAGISGYSLMATGLYFAWYDKYEQSSFHFFNDWNEWHNMDKAGHVYGAYAQASLIYDLGRWSGYGDQKALLISSVASIWGQFSIELMDGFSSNWGFSVSDLMANVAGTSLFYFQERKWKEQRLRMKMSYWPVSYSKTPFNSETDLFMSSQFIRSQGLYGKGGLERFLKDYNGQTIWLSADLGSFFPDAGIPKWISIALGFSANNLFGGFSNYWEINDENFIIDASLFPRSSQLVLALDINLENLQSHSVLGGALLKVLNVFKFPAPAISYDTQQGLNVHLFFLN